MGPIDRAGRVGSDWKGPLKESEESGDLQEDRGRADGGKRSGSGPISMGVLCARDGLREAKVGAADRAFVDGRQSEKRMKENAARRHRRWETKGGKRGGRQGK